MKHSGYEVTIENGYTTFLAHDAYSVEMRCREAMRNLDYGLITVTDLNTGEKVIRSGELDIDRLEEYLKKGIKIAV